jgi:pimeloyl-ACP methyl ester carboxylesterase
MIAAVLAATLWTVGSVQAAPSAAPSVTSRQIDVFGQKIHYVEAGAGPTVILLHGLADTAGVWADTIPALAPRFHVYALDQLGFGESDKPFINYRVQTLVEFLDGFYRAAGIDTATLVGNSLGGWVAASFALAHPNKVNQLVLVDSAGSWKGIDLTAEWLAPLNPPSMEALRQTLALMFYDKSLVTDAFVVQAWTEQLKHGDGYTVSRFLDSFLRREDDIDSRASGIKAPTLVVWGREDALLPLAQGEAFVHAIGGAKLAILDRCGHMPQVECPGPLNAAILAFLAK